MFPNIKIVEAIRKEYPAGTRIRLVKMDDIQAPPLGTEGTVVGVDDTGSLLMHWDNGSHLNIVYGSDDDEKKICTLRVAEHYRCQGIATKLLKIAHQALQCTNPLITVSSIHINEFEFLLKKNGFTLYKKYENYYKQGIVEYAFNGLLPEKQNNCRMSQNVV